MENLKVGSIWDWKHWRKNKNSLELELQNAWINHNIMPDEGIEYILDSALSQGSQKSAFYVTLFSGEYTPVSDDTYQSPGYTEAINYDGNRPLWQEAGVLSNSLTNAGNEADFIINGSATINGGSIVSASTKGDLVSGEVLLCAAAFETEVNVMADDVLSVTVEITGYST